MLFIYSILHQLICIFSPFRTTITHALSYHFQLYQFAFVSAFVLPYALPHCLVHRCAMQQAVLDKLLRDLNIDFI